MNGLDRLQRAIGALPIKRQGHPITTAAPTDVRVMIGRATQVIDRTPIT